eukprot:GILI01010767.1.p1 GENE.GILI01010767.1~~GILI01010767.1.p1  ORF type:complete len:598 (-),score=61.24 GILI01010767.1:62-1855(-)
MDKYEIVKQIGDGTYGTVAKAVHKKTGQLVAIKRMKQKYYSWDECIKLPEVQALRKLHAHPNVIKLKEVLRERNELFFVFEFMDGDLLGVIRTAKANPPLNPQMPFIPHTKVRAIMYQMFQSLAHLHKCGYFHRDLKPENMLIRKDPSSPDAFDIVKLADFGLVKEIRAKPPYTDYVSTRWYRGPELLLQDRAYSSPVDMWACGCIMVELMSTRPLFPGSNELDQLFRIISVMGPPTEKTWPEGCAMARKLRYTFPNPATTPLRKMVPPHIPPNAFDLIEKLLVYDPRKRLTASQALQHPYFTVGGIGLEGPLAFQQPLETAGMLRPQNTSSAPPSQLGGGVPPTKTTIESTKPGSADRPLMPPINIARPSAVGVVPSLNNTQTQLPSIASPQGGGMQATNGYSPAYGSQYHIRQSLQGHVSPSSTFNGSNGYQPSSTLTRPPTKIESPLPQVIPSAVGKLPAPTVMNKRASVAAGNDDLDDLLEEFSKNVEKDSKSTGLAPMKYVSSATKPPTGIEESPLQKLLSSARYRNTSGNTPNTENVLYPPTTFATNGTKPGSLSTPIEGRRKVVPSAVPLTNNVKPLIDKLSPNEPTWLK